MWKVAASLGPGTAATAAQAALPAASKVLPYARWIALGTSLIYLLLGGLALGLDLAFIVGPICLAIGIFVAILEYPFVPLARFAAFNFFCNYWYRAGLYACFCVPAFFNTITILCGLAAIATAGCWAFCAFKGAKGEPVTKKPKNATEVHDEEAGHHGAHNAHAQPAQPAQEQRKSSRFSGFFGGGSQNEPQAIVEPTPVAAPPEKSSRKSKFSLSSQAGRG
eukprot:Phypoly_transcript_14063.p1 GENE.Phypoly_transcript_14063~~Phypoly_transcript_14063.p1  ORF type:complete len:222 (+),score=27.47 Phypoly_transcript_14063:147-812(+)